MESFHAALPVHTHRHCKNCRKTRRFEGGELFKCGRCLVYNYCSAECQKEHWPSHKLECKQHAGQRSHLTAATGNPKAYVDLMSWVEYHHTTLINCTIAAMDLPHHLDAQQYTFFSIVVKYRKEPGQKMQSRFTFVDCKLFDIRDPDFVTHPMVIHMRNLLKDRPRYVAMGKQEFGREYGGTGIYHLSVDFEDTAIPFVKAFSFDKATARAQTNPRWRDIFEDNINEGKKIHFCCGKISDGICCCGGWTHAAGNPEALDKLLAERGKGKLSSEVD